ncbi:MAG: hypothetical protein J07HX64_00111 [halophilic archaeon J07HX64]|nr:MAG: hypothetical protein J07HX64_00111 [halophilic archaeon J07HX64]
MALSAHGVRSGVSEAGGPDARALSRRETGGTVAEAFATVSDSGRGNLTRTTSVRAPDRQVPLLNQQFRHR